MQHVFNLIIIRLQTVYQNMYNFLHVASCTLKKKQQLCNIDDVGNSVFYF